jgi:hypothetical protein
MDGNNGGSWFLALIALAVLLLVSGCTPQPAPPGKPTEIEVVTPPLIEQLPMPREKKSEGDAGTCCCPYCSCTQTGPVPGQPCVCDKSVARCTSASALWKEKKKE